MSDNAPENPRIWVSLPLDPAVLRHFLEFDDPATAMATVLESHVTAEPELLVTDNSKDQFGAETSVVRLKEGAPAPRTPFDEVRVALHNADQRVDGYGTLRRAAEIAYRHFGDGWTDPDPASPHYDTRERLRHIIGETLQTGHSNKSVPWRRFQDFAIARAEARRS